MVTKFPSFLHNPNSHSVAEPLNDDGSFRQDVFFNILGSGYIATALRAARAADPAAKLYINEFNVEGLGTSLRTPARCIV